MTSEYEITMIDFSYVDLLKNGKIIENGFKELYIENRILYAKMENSYLIFDTKTGESYSFYVEQFIKNGGEIEKLMSPSNFHSNYWGWRIFFT